MDDLREHPKYDDVLVSKSGEVMTKDRIVKLYNGGKYLRKGTKLKGGLDTKGYKQVDLRYTAAKTSKKVHRLVAETYLEPIDGLTQVNHIDGDKTNNHVDNLEWCDSKYNNVHASRLGLSYSKLSADDVINIRTMISAGIRQKDIAKKYGVTDGCIIAIKKRHSWAWLDNDCERGMNNE